MNTAEMYDDLYEDVEDESEMDKIIFHISKDRRNYTQFADDGDLLFNTAYIAECVWVGSEAKYERGNVYFDLLRLCIFFNIFI